MLQQIMEPFKHDPYFILFISVPSLKTLEVLHLYRYCEEDSHGGIERYLSILCEALAPEVRSTLLVSAPGPYHEEKEMTWGKIIKVPRFGEWKSTALNPTLFFKFKNNPCDIVHLHWPFPVGALACLMEKTSQKLIVSYHMETQRFPILQKIFSPFLKQILAQTNAIIVNSPPILKNSQTLHPFLPKCHIIPYGIQIKNFSENSDILTASRQIKETYKQPLILYAGRVVWYKGIHILIQAMKGINATLLIVGDGPLRKQLEKIVIQEEVKERVIFIGKVSSLLPYYYASEFLVLPSISRSESFGIVQLEAMACKKPVISTELGTGTSWVNHHNVTGLVIKPGDPGELRQSINFLLANPSLKIKLGENGRKRVEKQFAAETMALKTLEIYKQIANSA